MRLAAIGGLGVLLLAQAAQRPLQGGRPPQPQLSEQELLQHNGGEPAAVLNAERVWGNADLLLPLAVSDDPGTRASAVRALGRLEQPALVPRLIALGSSTAAIPTGTLVAAIVQSLHGVTADTIPDLIDSTAAWLLGMAARVPVEQAAIYASAASRLPYASPAGFRAAEHALDEIIDKTRDDPLQADAYLSSLAGLGRLASVNASLESLEADSVKWLTGSVAEGSINDLLAPVREAAFAALIAARGVNSDTETTALKDESPVVRRLAMTVLAGGGAGLEDQVRVLSIEAGLRDTDPQVRVAALAAYARHRFPDGCTLVADLILDPDTHVALGAIDALAGACPADDDLTSRLIAEARPPSAAGWNRSAHAFLALARRDPDRAAISMQAYSSATSWWLRMYAARAAKDLKDVIHLRKLAYDDNDNVREAAIQGLVSLKDPAAPEALLAALTRTDYQLVRSAAIILKKAAPDTTLAAPLMAALARITREQSENSRDARQALIDALAVHGTKSQGEDLRSIAADIDPQIAEAAAALSRRLTGKAIAADPAKVTRGFPQAHDRLDVCVSLNLDDGPVILKMLPEDAPLTVDRFLKLALDDHYYDGLTFHRVVSNFVIQGGSPGANEYVGRKEFMRDEIAASNQRGTVGLSTRGRNTADGQFYINLVDNLRLDGDYTVFATVVRGLDLVDRVQEGDTIASIKPIGCTVR